MISWLRLRIGELRRACEIAAFFLPEQQREGHSPYDAPHEVYHVVVYPAVARDKRRFLAVAVAGALRGFSAAGAPVLRLEGPADNAVGKAT